MSHLASYGIRQAKLLLRMSLLIKINNIMRFRYAPQMRGNFLLVGAIVPVHESYTKNKKSQFLRTL